MTDCERLARSILETKRPPIRTLDDARHVASAEMMNDTAAMVSNVADALFLISQREAAKTNGGALLG